MSKYNIAGFWLRIGALLIDCIILGIIGLILGVIFKSYFISLGNNGIILGFIISLLYFSLLNSRILGGRTLGKMLMNIKVVDEDDNLISFNNSFFRTLIILVPYFFIGFVIPGTPFKLYFQEIHYYVFTCILTGLVLVYILNKSTRQSIHDLIVKTFVVLDDEESEQIQRSSVKKYVFYTYFSLIAIITVVFSFSLIKNLNRSNDEKYFKLEELDRVMKKIDGISDVNNSTNAIIIIGNKNNSKTENFICNIRIVQPSIIECSGSDLEKSVMIKSVLKLIINTYPDAIKLNSIAVQINYGYDIGIAKSIKWISLVKTPNEWMELVNN